MHQVYDSLNPNLKIQKCLHFAIIEVDLGLFSATQDMYEMRQDGATLTTNGGAKRVPKWVLVKTTNGLELGICEVQPMG